MLECRYAIPEDFSALTLMRHALSEEERGAPLTKLESLRIIEETAAALQNDKILILLVHEAKTPVGMLWCFSGSLVGSAEEVMRTDLLYIMPDYRKSRAMKVLWDAAHRTAEASGKTKMQGMVLAKNTYVRRMWEKRGARVRAVVMEKSCEQSVVSAEGCQQEPQEGGGRSGAGSAGLPAEPVSGSASPDQQPDPSESSDLRASRAGRFVPKPVGHRESVGQ